MREATAEQGASMSVFGWRVQRPERYRAELSRMASLDQSTLSFGSALLLGLAGGNLTPPPSTLHYNGSGFASDLQAIGSDFDRSITRFDRLRRAR